MVVVVLQESINRIRKFLLTGLVQQESTRAHRSVMEGSVFVLIPSTLTSLPTPYPGTTSTVAGTTDIQQRVTQPLLPLSWDIILWIGYRKYPDGIRSFLSTYSGETPRKISLNSPPPTHCLLLSKDCSWTQTLSHFRERIGSRF